MRIRISHRTAYTYEQPVDYGLQQVRLRPISSALQTVGKWQMTVEGGAEETSYFDHHGNAVSLVCADQGAQAMTITVDGEVETHDLSGVLGQVYGRAPLWYFQQATALTEAGPLISDLAKSVADHGSDLDMFHALSASIIERVPYTLNETHSETKAEESVSQGQGVCQDHANIFISAARHLGRPARYVSGYLFMDGQIDQEASHAWAETHIDGLGWVGFDVSNGICPDPRYVRIAIGRDASEAAPISGLRMGDGDESLVVSLQVQQ